MTPFNKNDKQHHFNQVKGIISEINEGEKFCDITLDVGHENIRQVNLIMKKSQFTTIVSGHKIGDKICAKFYITSRKKNERWYTSANLLSIEKSID